MTWVFFFRWRLQRFTQIRLARWCAFRSPKANFFHATAGKSQNSASPATPPRMARWFRVPRIRSQVFTRSDALIELACAPAVVAGIRPRPLHIPKRLRDSVHRCGEPPLFVFGKVDAARCPIPKRLRE
jgi:hypothetical protein